MFAFDDRPEDVHQFQHTDFEEDIKVGSVTFEVSKHKIFIKKIVESFLLDSTIDYILGHVLLLNAMLDFKPLAPKVHLDVDFVFEHVMRSVEIILEIVDLLDFGA